MTYMSKTMDLLVSDERNYGDHTYKHTRQEPMIDAIDAAESIIRQALASARRPYIAFSGGKDSLVVEHLVSRIDDSVPLVYCDDEMLYPEHVSYMLDMKAVFGDRLRVVTGGATHADWFVPWKTTPRWREPDPDMQMEPFDWMHVAISAGKRKIGSGQFAARLGYDSAILGMRRAESLRRADILASSSGISRLNGITYINPIIEWTARDVWQYIQDHELPYCGVYDVMEAIGVGRHKSRVGPLPLSQGDHLWKGWPQMYIELIRAYGRRWIIPRRKPHKMDMLTWLELQEVLSGR